MRDLFLAGLLVAGTGLAASARGVPPPLPCIAPGMLAENTIAVDESQAPGMQIKPLGGASGQEVFFLTFRTGDDVVAGLQRFARLHRVRSGSVTAVGALGCTITGWYDIRTSRLHTRALRGNREVTSLTGNLAVMGDRPLAHLHVSVADRYGRLAGGHLVRAIVGPGLEVTVTASPEPLMRIDHRDAAAFVPVMP